MSCSGNRHVAEGASDVKQAGGGATKQNRMALRTTLSHNGRRQFSGLSVVVRTFPSRMNHEKEVEKVDLNLEMALARFPCRNVRRLEA